MKEKHKYMQVLKTLFIVLIISSTPVIAQSGGIITGGDVIESFETGNLGTEWSGDTNGFSVVNEKSYDGDFSLKDDNDASTFDTITRTLPTKAYTSIGFAFYYDEPQVLRAQRPAFSIGDANSNSLIYPALDDGSVVAGADSGSIIYFDGSSWRDTGINMRFQQWTVWNIENINYTSETADLYVYYGNGTEIGNATIEFRESGSEFGGFSIITYEQATTYYDYIAVNGTTLSEPITEERELEIEINRWMGHNSTQPYTVRLNQTNTTTGDSNITDVTDNANVTIYNITNTSGFSNPIATVNNSTDTIKSYSQTGVVAVNATYNGETANATNLTVGNRNLSNIGIMPPGQWISSFLGVDETSGDHNIGSTTQWLVFIIIVASGFGRAFKNDWIGMGLGMLTSILLWVVGFVGLGIMLSVIFFGIFVGVLKVRVTSNSSSETTVNINDTRDFRR